MSSPAQILGDTLQSLELRVLLLGPLRLAMHADHLHLPYPPDGSQEVFWKLLADRFPALHANRGAIRIARDDRFLLPEDKLKPGDEIALIPPVSGG